MIKTAQQFLSSFSIQFGFVAYVFVYFNLKLGRFYYFDFSLNCFIDFVFKYSLGQFGRYLPTYASVACSEFTIDGTVPYAIDDDYTATNRTRCLDE